MQGIVFVDMHIRDERVFKWIKERACGGSVQITAHDIALCFGCHRNTATTILKRLHSAGHLVTTHKSFRGGHSYRVAS